RFRSLVEHTSDAVFCYEYDPPIPTSLPLDEQVRLLYSGRLVECNKVAAKYYGCDRVEDVLGKRLSDLFKASPSGPVDELFCEFIRGGYHIVEGETFEEDSGGSRRYYSNNAHGVISEGNLLRVWGAYREITERKKADEALRESEEKFRALFELSPYSAAYADLEGKIIACNEQFVKLHACRGGTEAQVGRNVSELVPEEEKPLMLSVIRKTIESRRSQGAVEYTLLREDGTRFPGEVTCSVIAGHDGEPKGLLGLAQDIAERKEAEEALRESEQRFRVLAEKSPNMIFINARGRVIYANEKCEEIMGYKKEEFYEEGFDFLGLIAPEDRERMMQKYSMHMAGQDVEPYDYSLVGKQGQKIEAINATKLIEYRGQKAILGIVTDITERKRAAEALAHSEQKYRGFVENFLGIVYQWENPSFKPNFFHGAVEEITGYTEEDFAGAVVTWDELIEPEDIDGVRSEGARLRCESDHVSDSVYRIRRRDGGIRWVRDTARRVRIDDSDLVQGVIYDITERKKTEDALGDVLKMSDDIVREIPSGLFIYKYKAPDSLVLLHGNPEAERLTGVVVSESVGKEFNKIWPNAKELGITDSFLGPMKTGEMYETEGLFYKDEKYEGVSRIRVFRLPGDKLAVAFEDITERKRAEEELRKSEGHYRMLAETMNEGLAQLAADGTYVYVNEKHCAIFGYSPDDMIGEHWTKFYTGDARKVIESQFAGRKKGLAKPYEVAISREDGREVHLLISPQPIFDEEGDFKGSLSILTDITDRKKAEEKARRHQSELAHVWRVNTMGEMASGLAHELNQPLCAILNYANACLRIMKTRTDITEDMTESIKQVASQADRAGQIIKRIRSLVAKRKPQTSAVDINYIVGEVVELERGEAGKMEVTVRTKLGEDLPHVLADSVEIEEVILNLVRNAFDAMIDPTVERREVTIITRKTKGRFVEVCVKDTGKGFAAFGEQIFDSFFTTKPDGLGIGLSISRTIVELHGGKLWAEENPDCGASFKFTLPAKRG
ncbi:MAG: PAS domain S-box protein, partial [Planctomycetota bacterium]